MTGIAKTAADWRSVRGGFFILRRAGRFRRKGFSPVEHQPGQIGQYPADGYRPPDALQAHGGDGGQQVGQGHPRPQGDHGEHHRHAGPPQAAEQAVEQKQDADAAVAHALNAQVLHPHGDNLRLAGLHKQAHEGGGEEAHQQGADQAEAHGHPQGGADPLSDALRLLRAGVLGHEGGEGVAEVLDGQVGEGVDLDGGGKGGHHVHPEGVHQPLHHQDAEVHHRLLHAGEQGVVHDAPQLPPGHLTVPPLQPEQGHPPPAVEGDTGGGHPLGEHRGPRGPGHPPAQSQDKPEIQPDVEDGGHGQKGQRGHGVAHRAQQAGEVVIEEGEADAQQHHPQVGPGLVPGPGGDAQQGHHRLQQGQHSHVEQHRHSADKHKGGEEAPLQLLLPLRAVEHGPQGAAAHAQAQQHRGEKGHQGKGEPHRRQGRRPQRPAHNESVGNVVALLEQVARDHGTGEQQHRAGDSTPGQIHLHWLTHFRFECFIFLFVRIIANPEEKYKAILAFFLQPG